MNDDTGDQTPHKIEKRCGGFFTVFGTVMLVCSLIFMGVSYSWGGEKRAALEKVETGEVSPVEVEVSSVIEQRYYDTSSRTYRYHTIVNFITADGRRFERSWTDELEGHTNEKLKAYIVDDVLLLPQFYDERDTSGLIGLPLVGLIFFMVFRMMDLWICRSEHRRLQEEGAQSCVLLMACRFLFYGKGETYRGIRHQYNTRLILS